MLLEIYFSLALNVAVPKEFSKIYLKTSESILNVSRESFFAKKKKKKKIGKKACNDGIDNDSDGLIDFPADPDCTKRKDNSENSVSENLPNLGVGASLNGRRPFPDNNPWNQDISNAEVDPNSNTLINSIGLSKNIHPDFGTFWDGAPIGIPYVVVSGTQEGKTLSFDYDDESDHALYPVPANPPIEGGDDSDGDRHILMVDRDNWVLYELFYAFPQGNGWSAGSGAIFDLNSNELRPNGWTSADAAGLPIFPGLVRYDEVIENGEINHALRFTAQQTRKAYVSPARHHASSLTSAAYPPMGMRVRLKASFNISGFSPSVQVILRALKKYGMFLADNGSDWFISGAHDPRWNDDDLSEIKSITGSAFEVVKMGEITTN
ncbi:MAG: hypothetical protein SGJ02_08915 [bacterium]|nr:hypothetical protein [bacterium]